MDVTAILDESGNQLFPTAKILRMSTAPSNTFATHTVEDGTTVTDNKILNQTRLSATLVLDANDYATVYQEIKSTSNETKKLTIQTRVDTFYNMYIEAYPNEESAAIFDTIHIAIDFIEQMTVTVLTKKLASSDVSNQSNVDTESRGEQLPKKGDQTALQQIAGFF